MPRQVFIRTIAFANFCQARPPRYLTAFHFRRGRLRFMLRPADLLLFQDLTLRFDTGLSPDAGSLLPSPLAVTRTGLSPASQATLPWALQDLWKFLPALGLVKLPCKPLMTRFWVEGCPP
jgi:hypothetical protein